MRVCCALLLIAFASVLRPAAQEAPVVRVEVELVLVEIEVTDADGKLVQGLARDDFTVTEDGRGQEIRTFSRQRIPYRTLVLVDCSGSLSEGGHFVPGAVESFIDRLHPSDYAGIATFGRSAEVIIDWTRRDQWTKEIAIPSGASYCRESDVYGSIASAVEHLRRLEGRRAALIITDGIHSKMPVAMATVAGLNIGRIVDPADDPDFQRLLRMVEQASVPLYFAALNTDLNPISMSPVLQPATDYSPLALYNLQQVRARLEQLAAASGGQVVYPRSPQEYVPLFQRVELDMGYVYSLGYTPAAPPDGKYHRIDVRVRGSRLNVRQSREGYDAR